MMKLLTVSLIAYFALISKMYAQDTFSIVAADSSTREVGSAGASCVDLFSAGIADATFLGDLLPDTGTINSQASYLAANQNNARTRMRAGDSPAQIISWLTLNDAGSDSTIRQYGIVEFSGSSLSAAGYTGANCMDYKNHRTGSINGIYYSIQGNILLGQLVIDSMESKFRNAQGDLACRLMAALQGAKMVGADTRCTTNGTSSLFAFVKVSQPTDSYGNPSFKLSVRTHTNAHIEPIDTLQTVFNLQHACGTSGINATTLNNYIKIYPNPSTGKIKLVMTEQGKGFQDAEILIFNLFGEQMSEAKLIAGKTEIDLSKERKGIYYYRLQNGSGILETGKIIVE